MYQQSRCRSSKQHPWDAVSLHQTIVSLMQQIQQTSDKLIAPLALAQPPPHLAAPCTHSKAPCAPLQRRSLHWLRPDWGQSRPALAGRSWSSSAPPAAWAGAHPAPLLPCLRVRALHACSRWQTDLVAASLLLEARPSQSTHSMSPARAAPVGGGPAPSGGPPVGGPCARCGQGWGICR